MSEFKSGNWQKYIDVRDFIARNYTPYDGDESFLAPPTARTKALWDEVSALMKEETARGGVYDIDTHTISGIDAYAPGYIDREKEQVVGLQTAEPLCRAIMPFGGMRMVRGSLEAYGRELDPEIEKVFEYRKTHNDGVFDVYTKEMRAARKSGVITGLPDAYGRGRIIGDYRRVALYGVDHLIEEKQHSRDDADFSVMDSRAIRLREELAEQVRALEALKRMAASYGFDISVPAKDTKEAVQWLYFGYLAAVKEQNGAAMSIGRVSTFLDIYAEKDLAEGRYTESEIQEIVDHFIMKLRMVRFLRTPAYDELFSGDPTWVTESIGGICTDGRHMVTKMSFRFLHTLTNLGPAPEPNMTVLWSPRLPENFKRYCAKVSIETCSIQYESDELMRKKFGDDYGIACCVSAMRIGKQMQFFGARCNMAKALLYAINGGRDEKSGVQVGPELLACRGKYLDYDDVMKKFDTILDWLAQLYINTLNVIHYMHDKYCYEKIQMALHDNEVLRTMACGMAGLSVVCDSLSAIKYAKVRPIRNDDGLAVDFEVEGDFPKFGNNDPRVDDIAVDVVKTFMRKLRKCPTYRESVHTLSILTITSNVVYGKKTGSTPDGRKAGEPFAPGANPMHGRDSHGCVASMMSVAKLPYDYSEDGISYTFSIVPGALGKSEEEQADNLVGLMDGYFNESGHHINVNVLNRELLLDAMDHPEQYPQLTIRVSGYAVNFVKLTREQQLDVINRTFHTRF
ncbi:formate C-acetyltransferase [Clostridia bacterium]|jgi:formate C-acetyltransferase